MAMVSTHSGPFHDEVNALRLDFVVSALMNCPESLAPLLHAKLRLAARRLARVAKLDEQVALDVMARVVGAVSWPALDKQLRAVHSTATEATDPTRWLNPFTPAAVLLCEPVAGVALDAGTAQRFEALARSIARQSMQRLQDVRDGVCARFCGCDSWDDAVYGAGPTPTWRPTNL
jgi:hypothetical protein